jgi:hypothetical protein
MTKPEDTTLPVGAPFERPVGRLEPEREDEAARLAQKMAKAAGPQKARVMAQACYMLLCTAALTADPDGYFAWLEKQR